MVMTMFQKLSQPPNCFNWSIAYYDIKWNMLFIYPNVGENDWVGKDFHAKCWKMAKDIFKILLCEHRKILKACLTIFQHYARKEKALRLKLESCHFNHY